MAPACHLVGTPALRALARGGGLPLQVAGPCMAPALREGEAVVVAPARAYFPGDVIAFRQGPGGRLLLHRVLGYRPWGRRWALVVRGDACASPDAPVFPEQVIGRAYRALDNEPPLGVPAAERVRAAVGWLRLCVRWLLRRLP